MNRKQLTALIVLVLALGGLAYILQKKKDTSWESGEKPVSGTVLKEFPLNDVTEIVIKDKDGSLTLTKKDDRWTVAERNHYPANFQEIGGLLRKVWDLKPVQQPKVGESQLGRLELEAPGKGDRSGTLVEFNGQGGKALGSLLLGKKHMRESSGQFGGGSFADGRYLMIPGKLESIALVAESFDEIVSKPADWLSKGFFKVEKTKSVSVSTNGVETWKITRENETAEWKLAGLKEEEKQEPSAAGAFNHLLASASFNDLVTDAAEMKNPVKAVVETFDGFKYELTLSPKESSEDYLLKVAVTADLPAGRAAGPDEKPEDKARLDKEFQDRSAKLAEKLKAEKLFEGHTFLISKFTVDPLLKARTDFIAKKQEKPPE